LSLDLSCSRLAEEKKEKVVTVLYFFTFSTHSDKGRRGSCCRFFLFFVSLKEREGGRELVGPFCFEGGRGRAGKKRGGRIFSYLNHEGRKEYW